eukprot:14650037-Alexandrium_andersonii.AAC.1
MVRTCGCCGEAGRTVATCTLPGAALIRAHRLTKTSRVNGRGWRSVPKHAKKHWKKKSSKK